MTIITNGEKKLLHGGWTMQLSYKGTTGPNAQSGMNITHPNHFMGHMDCLDRIPPHIFIMSHPPPLDNSLDDSTNLHHTFYSSDTYSLPSHPLSPCIQDLPIQSAFTAAYRCSGSPFTDWLTSYHGIAPRTLLSHSPKPPRSRSQYQLLTHHTPSLVPSHG